MNRLFFPGRLPTEHRWRLRSCWDTEGVAGWVWKVPRPSGSLDEAWQVGQG